VRVGAPVFCRREVISPEVCVCVGQVVAGGNDAHGARFLDPGEQVGERVGFGHRLAHDHLERVGNKTKGHGHDAAVAEAGLGQEIQNGPDALEDVGQATLLQIIIDADQYNGGVLVGTGVSARGEGRHARSVAVRAVHHSKLVCGKGVITIGLGPGKLEILQGREVY